MITAPKVASIAALRLSCRIARGAAAASPTMRGDRHHGAEQRHLDDQQAAVIGAGQRIDTADQVPAIDDAADQQRRNAHDAERREAQGGDARDAEVVGLAPGRLEQQRERHQRAKPRCRGDQVQDIGDRMGHRLDAEPATAVPGPRQAADEDCSQHGRHDPEPSGWRLVSRQQWPERGSEAARNDQANEPIPAEIGLCQHRPEHVAGQNVSQRLAAHRRRGQYQPLSS